MKKYLLFFYVAFLMIAMLLLLIRCNKAEVDKGSTPPAKPDVIFYGLSADNELVKYNSKAPDVALSIVTITGLADGEKLMSIDFRPATGQLYGIGKSSRLYTINPESGVAYMAGSGPFAPAITGDFAGFDFNPVDDRARIVTSAGQNFRLDPETGPVVVPDEALKPGSPSVVAAAYTNSYAGASSTTLFDIDLVSQKLVRQSPAGEGALTEIGSLKITWASGETGFDISPDNKVALASLSVNGENGLYQIDTATGKATKLGILAIHIIGLAIPPRPVGYAADAGNTLYIFNFQAADSIFSKPVTGLRSREKILGLDMRPATGQLYALGSSYRIYTINMATGAATPVGSAAFTSSMNGSAFGFDFDPAADQIRLVSNTGENLRVNPVTGALISRDTRLKPSPAAISSAAYTNNVAGATASLLFDINWNTDKLYRQEPASSGILAEVGLLGTDVESAGGFDIGGTSGNAYALLTSETGTRVYSIDLMTGMATAITDFPFAPTAFTIGLGF